MGWYDVNVKAPAAGSQMPSVAPGAVLGQGISNAIGGFLERTAKIRAEEAAKQKMAYDMAQEAAAMQLKQQAMEQAKEDSRLDRILKEAQLKQAKEIADKNFLMDERKLGAEMANAKAARDIQLAIQNRIIADEKAKRDLAEEKLLAEKHKENVKSVVAGEEALVKSMANLSPHLGGSDPIYREMSELINKDKQTIPASVLARFVDQAVVENPEGWMTGNVDEEDVKKSYTNKVAEFKAKLEAAKK